MKPPTRTPADVAKLGSNFSLVAEGLEGYIEHVEQPSNLILAYRRAIRAIEDGQVALGEVMIKAMCTPELPHDWSV